MSTLAASFDRLTPQQRKLLLVRLRKQGLSADALFGALEPRARDGGAVELSSGQRRLWFLEQLDRAEGVSAGTYNVAGAVRLCGRLDTALLVRSLAGVAGRHEALRTTFHLLAGRPVQWIHPRLDPEAVRIDLSALPAGRRTAAARAAAGAAAARPFDLAAGPLLRLAILDLGPLRPAEAEEREHLAVLSLHHIVADGWSLGVLIGELAAFYGAGALGHAVQLPELPVQYADFALWQRDQLAGGALDDQLGYWRRRLADPPVLELPADRPRPPAGAPSGGAVELPFAPVAEALAAAAQAEGGTLFMGLLAAFAALLARLSGEADLVIGTPVAGRGWAEVQGLIGLFVNTLALRLDLAGDAGLRGLLGQARETALAAFAHQDLPFDRLVEELAPQRQLGHSPLFQVMLALQDAPLPPVELPGVALEPFGLELASSQFDLTLSYEEGGVARRPRAQLHYRRGLFDHATVERWGGHLARWIAAAVAEPDRPASEVSLLAAAERHQLAREWNDTAAAAAAPALSPFADAGLHLLFEAQAARRPGAVALVCGEAATTYGELDRRAGELAAVLGALGVGPEVPVGVCLDRSCELAVALLAVWKAGGAYVPLDPAHPRGRLLWQTGDAGVRLIVTDRRRAAELVPDGAPEGALADVGLLCLDAPLPAAGAAPAAACAPGQLAYVIYTSGSTGDPNGVLVPHRGAVHLLRQAAALYRVTPSSRVLQVASIGFDASLLEIFLALAHGASLCIVPEEERLSPGVLADRLVRQGVTTAVLTPSFLGVLPEPRLPGLTAVSVGGEACTTALAARWAPRRRLLNCYGPTEATIFATVELLDSAPEPRAMERPPSIGRPVSGAGAYVLDPGLSLVPLGAPGELALGGVGLARGYLGRPAKTAERFVPHPWAEEPGSRLYRTGDLVRRRPDGRLEFLGRSDQQVKIRGVRIEPGEVEAVLLRHPGVAAAAVLAPAGGGQGAGERRLLAWAVPQAGETLSAEGLRRHLAERLPSSMVPARVLLADGLPHNRSGKVDRRALARQAEDLGVSERRLTAPRTPAERFVAGLWQEVLGLPSVGVEDDFFALGGNSIQGAILTNRLQEELGTHVYVGALFDAPTVERLAAHLLATHPAGMARAAGTAADAAGVPEPRPAPALRRRAREGPVPLSFAQERLWFLDRLAPGTPAYNIAAAVRLTGELDPAALAAGFAGVVRRHEALRTRFGLVDGRPVQTVQEEGPGGLPTAAGGLPITAWGGLPLVDLGGLPAAAAGAEAGRLARAEELRPFDLARGPVLRATLLRCPRGAEGAEHLLLLTVHHIAGDAWSMGVLVRELGAFYRAFTTGEGPGLPELPIQYADFALWQRGELSGAELERQLAYWRRRLAGAPTALDLPADRPRPPVQSSQGGVVRSVLAPPLAGRLAALGGPGTTLFMTLLAGFQALLGRLTGQSVLLVGSPIANRTRRELEPLIGFFVNTLVLRADLHWQAGFAAHLAGVRETALGAYAHQDLPFELLVDDLRPQRDLSRSPLVQVLFQLENAPQAPLELPGLRLAVPEAQAQTAKLDLVVTLAEKGGGLEAGWQFSSDLFDAATVARFAGHFAALLAGAADPAAAELPLAELPLLSAAERHQLAVEGRVRVPGEAVGDCGCLHQRFAAVAAARPEETAAMCGEERWTYRELAERAHGLARQLEGVGVRPGERVGIFLDRSLELVAAVLGVLETGAAYVPVDPAYPAERVGFVLADSGVRAVVSRRDLEAGLAGLPAGVEIVWVGRKGMEEVPRSGEPLGGVRAAPESPAYVIYTSGSTGRPKGVEVSHAQVARLFDSTRAWFGFGPADVWTLFHSIAFDFSVWELWGALLHGGRLVVVPYEVSRSPEQFYELLAREGVTVLNQTPSAFRQLIWAEESVLARGGAAAAGLREVVFGGEALEPGSLAPWVARHGMERPRLVNMYGITETTVHVTYRPLSAVDVRRPAGSAIGVPLPDLSVHLVDRHLQLVPLGVPGEIVVGGAGLALGYLGRPDLTAERFVPDPFGLRPGARLYRSGDLARRRPPYLETDLEYLGRIDHQVKIRGFRIELGEIESALAVLPGVHEAVVMVREDGGEKRLAAYVTGEAEAVPGLSTARELLGRTLPDYMLPSSLTRLAALPLTVHGKVDRAALAALGAPEAGLRPGRVAPRTELERFLAGLFAEVLRTGDVGVDDDFFALGGNSINGAVLVNRLQQELGEIVPVVAIFDAPTVARLAADLAARHPAAVSRLWGAAALGEAGQDAVPAGRVDDQAADGGSQVRIEPGAWTPGTPAPLSFSQERLWFLDRLEPGSPAYHLPSALRLAGGLDVAALDRALDGVARRHAALRTTFPVQGGRPVQQVAAEPCTGWPVIDLSALDPARREAETRGLARSEARRPFDLAAGPLLRTTLLRLGEREHVALAVQHHIVSDGWSVGLFVRELVALYTAAAAGAPVLLAELPVQYPDYAVWQRRHLAGAALERRLAYWRERLAGTPPVLELPLDRPRTAAAGRAGRQRALPLLSAPLAGQLAALGRGHGASLFMTLLAGFAALLARASGQEDVVVGSPIAGRNRAEIEGLIGFFVNTLALRTDLSGDPDFHLLLARVRETALGAFEHQDLPFEKLVEDLAPERNLSAAPIFQVMFALQNAPAAELAAPGLAVSLVEADAGASKFDLVLGLHEVPGGIAGLWGYSAELFDGATVERLGRQLAALLAAAAAEPGRRISEVPLLAAAERQALLAEWNDTPGPRPPAGFVHRLVFEQAARRPAAPAVVFVDPAGRTAVQSYGELAARARRLARRLRAEGVGPEVPVGVFLERWLDLPATLLGVFAAGGTYLPLDPSYPGERLAFMLADAAQASPGVQPLVLTRESLLAALPAGLRGARILAVDPLLAAEPGAAAETAFDPAPDLLPENAAYVLYTSGSTGTPKGVVVPHRSLAERLRSHAFTLDASDSFLQKGAISFDASLGEILNPLITGGRAVLVPPAGVQSSSDYLRVIAEQGVTRLSFPPSALAVLLEEPAAAAALRGVRTVLTGSETVPAELPERFYRSHAAELFNCYGPTETTISVTVWRCRRGDPGQPPIGRPIRGAAVYVLDRLQRPVPPGVAGEICIGGAYAARGYLGRPDLTAAVFRPDPFAPSGGGGARRRSGEPGGARRRSGEPGGARLYATGDRGRLRSDGALEFLGRLDRQVKIRGFRVELGEIESALMRHPGVREAVVADRAEGASRALVAFLVPAGGRAPVAAELRDLLSRSLPGWMVPAAFVALPELPLSPAGKVDRRALSRLAATAAADAPEEDGAPEALDPVCELLAGIWQDLLGAERVRRVRPGDDFFALGGHSLLATQLASRVRETFGVELPLRAVFEGPTLAEMAARLAGAGGAAPPLVPVPRGDDPPLSFAQERLWFLDRLQPGSTVYNMPAALRLTGGLDVAALRAAFGEVVRRHEALRTTFALCGGAPVQVVAPPAPPPLPVADLAGLPAAAAQAELRRLIAAEAARPFDLAAGPLLRLLLARLGPGEHALAVNQHHIVSDGWSVGVLVRETVALYGALSAGLPPPLPDLPVQYADYALWQRGWLAGEALATQLGYWRERLAGAPEVTVLPADRPRRPLAGIRGRRRDVELEPALAAALRELCRREGVTLYMALLAGLAALLHRLGGQSDVVVGSPIAGRTRRELENLIGLFVNTLALRAELGGDPSGGELLGRVRQATLGAYAHQDLPFEKLVAELAPERSLSHAPLFQVMLVLQNTPEAVLAAPGLTFAPLGHDRSPAKFDLTLNLAERPGPGGDVVTGLWLYNAELFDAPTVARLSGQLRSLLAALARDPGVRVAELPLLTAAERQQIREWNATGEGSAGAGADLLAGFREWAEREPGRPAVVWSGGRLSYGALAARVRGLALRLCRLGVGPNVPVGLCAGRSPELLVGLLAIVEAGGAYVPLDPGDPAERLAWLAGDARLPVLLARAGLEDRLPCAGATVVRLDAGEEPEEPAGEAGALPSGAGPDDLLYVIYTSGSTGLPKGAGVRRGSFANLLRWYREELGLAAGDAQLVLSSPSFDLTQKNLLAPLLSGGRVCLAPEVYDPAALLGLIRSEGVVRLNCTPSAFYPLAESGDPSPLAGLRAVVLGGEPIAPERLAGLFRAAPGVRVVNSYGPTECTDVVAWHRLDGPDPAPVPLGRPLPGVRLEVLDGALRRLPAGAVGELAVAGLAVGIGYPGDAARTAARFVPDPFAAPGEGARLRSGEPGGAPRRSGEPGARRRSGEPGARLYLTGDLVRRLPGGEIAYVGRADGQVKIRGFRVELGEVEAQLRSHPEVREAAVVVRRQGDSVSLVAVVEPGAGAAATDLPSRLAEHLARRLPEPLVPARIVPLAALPLSPNGKVDRRALSDLGLGEAAVGGRAAARRTQPRTPVEAAVAELFREVLGTAEVGVEESFFALGGDSIRGAVLINRLQERLGELVHVVAIFDHPTVAALAAYLEREHAAAAARAWGVETRALPAEEGRTGPVDEAAVARLRAVIPPLPHRPAPARRNPRAVFVLSPPRSGSTLLRVLLAGHPRLFAPPELELLSFPDLAARRAALSGRDSFWREGLIRALMAARGTGAEAARQEVERAEGAALPAHGMYRLLQEAIGDRLLVDKSPSYALDPAVLARAEEVFEGALYIHLLRHPCGMIHSFEEARLEQVFFRHPHTLGRRELAELIWVVSQRNILDFLAGIPAGRRRCVQFERLVREPEPVLRELCVFLGIAYQPAMADPYGDLDGRMTDGLTAVSRMVGDVKLLQHREIDPRIADRWRAACGEGFLGEPARALARRLGYEVAPEPCDDLRIVPGVPGTWQEGAPLPLAFAQERLWFLDRLEPGAAAYHIPAALRLAGPLDRGALAAALAQVVQRHASLRTTFGESDGLAVQYVAPAGTVTAAGAAPALADLSALSPGRREAEVRALAVAHARRPFDLARGPLLRTLLVALARPGADGSGEEHALLVNLHHIVADGWSLGVLVREVTAVYAAAVRGLPPPLAALPVQYPDYAAWQRRRLRGALLDAEIEFWRGALAGAPPLDLPADRPRPPVLSSRGGRAALHLDAAVAAPLLALGRARGATPFMTLLAGFAALLHRHSGADDLSIGTPVAGRNRAELENLIGLFVNTLVVRVGLGGSPAAGELLARVRAAAVAAFAHQEVPFEKVVEELQPRRDPGRTPLFQVMFALQNAQAWSGPAGSPAAVGLPAGSPAAVGLPAGSPAAVGLPAGSPAGLAVSDIPLPGGSAKFDLTLSFSEAPGGGLAGDLEYNLDLFEPASVMRLGGQLEVLLAGIAHHPELPVGELPLLSAAERQQLREWGAGAPLPAAGDVGQLFSRQVALRPEAPALALAGGETWTYRELAGYAGLLAARLRALGAGPEVTVAVCLPRSPGLVCALLAVLEAGAAFLPLDPDAPPERLAWLLADAAAAVVCTERRLLGVLPADGRRVLLLDEPPGPPAASPAPEPVPATAALPLPEGSPESLAYVIYTSGSTGRPKGVGVTRAGLWADLVGVAAHWGFEPGDRTLPFSSPGFDVSLEEVLAPLAAGATLCFPPPAPWDPAAFLDLVQDLRLTVVGLPTAFWQAWAHECVRRPPPPDLTLRRVVVGSEGMSPQAARLWCRSPWGAVRLLNGYGPTEAVISATFLAVTAAAAEAALGAAVPIGRPLAGRTVQILDRRGLPVPALVPGELCLGGVLARGYLGRPDLTAERFLPAAWGTPGGWSRSGEPGGARLYHTGDLARWRVDGSLEFLGRLDQQVKIRGLRIEPGEVASALAAHPGLRDAAVVAADDPAGGLRLAAFVVPQGGAPAPGESELRAFLAAQLPRYMVPAAFGVLDDLPLTANGKVDRAALRRLAADLGRSPREGAIAPRTPVEEVVAKIWCEVLGREQVGVEDDFFTLGGHSLLVTQVVSRVKAIFQIELPLRRMFEHPTVAGLAADIAARERRPGQSERIARALVRVKTAPPRRPAGPAGALQIPPGSWQPGRPAPLSFAQERLWFLDRLAPGSPLYDIPAALRLAGRLDAAVLERSIAGVVRRHATLRTTFVEEEGRPAQVISQTAVFRLPGVDLSGLPAGLAEAELRALAAAARRPFDLARGPLLRALLVRLGGEEHALLLNFHHIVADGWSMGVLVREVAALYGAALGGLPAPLPELPVQYADYAVWQRQRLQGAVLEAEIAHWRKVLAGAVPLDLPADRPRPPVVTHRGASRSVHLEEGITAPLLAHGAAHGATPLMTLLAGFAVLLHRYAGQDDLSIGTPVSGRNHSELEGLIGFFANTLVVRIAMGAPGGDPTAAPSFLQLLRRVRAAALDAFAHQEVPFEKVVEALQPRRDPGRTPLIQVLFALQSAGEAAVTLQSAADAAHLPGLQMSSLPLAGETAFDLLLALAPGEPGAPAGGGFTGALVYNRDLFEAATMARFVRHLQTLLAGMARHPDQPVEELPLLTASERHQAMVEWGRAQTGDPPGRLLLEIESALVRHPAVREALVAGLTSSGDPEDGSAPS